MVGQGAIRQTLKNAVKSHTPSHAYLFSGSRGTGKTSAARILAKALNAALPDGNPDLQSPLSQALDAGNLTDVIEIDAASNNSVEDIRELRERVQFAPTLAGRKIYIIDEVHMLSKSAFNALLKTLEEPPEWAYFILATTELHKVPDTIVSRCQTFIFQRFRDEELLERLQYICDAEGYTVEREALMTLALRSEGGMRDAVGYLDQVAQSTGGTITEAAVRETLGLAGREVIAQLYQAVLAQDVPTAMALLDQVDSEGKDMRSFGRDVLQYVRLGVRDGTVPDTALAARVLERFTTALKDLRYAPFRSLPFEVAVLQLCQPLESGGVAPAPVAASVVSAVAAPLPPEPPQPPLAPATPEPATVVEPAAPAAVPVATPVTEAPGTYQGFTFAAMPVAPVASTASVPVSTLPAAVAPTAEGSHAALLAASGLTGFALKALEQATLTLSGGILTITPSKNSHAKYLEKDDAQPSLRQAVRAVYGASVSYRVGAATVTDSPPEEDLLSVFG